MTQERATFTSALKFDLPAGIIVAVVALPLALGFGVTSGAGAASGLVTAIVAGLIAGLLGGSRYQVSGPTGAMVVVLFPIISDAGMTGLLVVGVIAGALIVLFGLFRLGALAEKIPWSVMEGFTLGIAVVIALQQLPLIFGVTRGEGTETLLVAWRTLQHIGSEGADVWALMLVVLTLAIKVTWATARRRWSKLTVIPASAVAVILLSIVAFAFALPVAKVGAIPTSELFRFDFAWPDTDVITLLSAAVVVALLGGVESLLSARVADSMVHRRDGEVRHPYQPNRELIGQGLATIAASLVGGMPATGAIARTAVNVNAGARSRTATVTHSLVLLVFVFALGSVVSEIPLAVLAGILLGASWRIASPSSIVESLRTTWPNRIAYLVTAIGVVAIDLIWGIVIGITTHIITSAIARKLGR